MQTMAPEAQSNVRQQPPWSPRRMLQPQDALYSAPVDPADSWNTSGSNGDVPPQVAGYRWNWGAFFLGWIWCFNHGQNELACTQLFFILAWWFIVLFALTSDLARPLCQLAVVGCVGIAIYLGARGHRLAWKGRRFAGGVPEFLAVESRWSVWGYSVGAGVAGISLFMAILVAVFGALMFGMRQQQAQTSPQAVNSTTEAGPPQTGPAPISGQAPRTIIVVPSNRLFGPMRGGQAMRYVPGEGMVPVDNSPYPALPAGYDNYGHRIVPNAPPDAGAPGNQAPANTAPVYPAAPASPYGAQPPADTTTAPQGQPQDGQAAGPPPVAPNDAAAPPTDQNPPPASQATPLPSVSQGSSTSVPGDTAPAGGQ